MSEQKCPECNGFRGLPRMLHHDEIPKECDNAFHKTEAPIEPEPEPENEKVLPEVLQMPTPGPPAQKVPNPVCPFCETEVTIQGKKTIFGPYQVMVIQCGACRKVLGGFQILDLQPMPMPSGLTH